MSFASFVWHRSFTCVTLLLLLCNMPALYVRHDSLVCVKTPSYVRYDSHLMCDMTLSYVWHDWFVRATWLVRTCDMTLSYVRSHIFVCVTWPLLMHDTTPSHAWHFCQGKWGVLHVTPSYFLMLDMTPWHMWHDSSVCVMSCALFLFMTWLLGMRHMTVASFECHDCKERSSVK